MMKNKIRDKADGVLYFLSIVLLGVLVLVIAKVNLFHYCYNINADIASEAVLAKLIHESGEWIPQSWYPSTELRIFGTPNLAAMIYGLTKNMIFSMGISCVLMTLGILASAYFFATQIQFSKEKKILFLILCLVIPNHFVTLELVYLFAGYYSVHVIILFFTMGVYARTLQKEKINYGLLLVALFLSFCMGMQGVRGILILAGPLVLTEGIRLAYLLRIRKIDRKSLMIALWSCLLFAFGYLGTRLPFSVGHGIERNIRKGPAKLWNNVIPDAIKSIGFPDAGNLGKVILLLLLLIAGWEVFLLIRKIIKGQSLDAEDWSYLFFWISPILTMLIVAFTTTESSERYFFVFLYLLAFAGATEKIEFCKKYWTGYVFAGALLIVVLLMVYFPILKHDELKKREEYQVAAFLEERGYETAYATFETANTITVLSNGNVQGAAVASVKEMSVCKWLSSVEWYVPHVPYEKRTAYIVTEAEQSEFADFYEKHKEKLKLETQIGKFYIFGSDYNFSKTDSEY